MSRKAKKIVKFLFTFKFAHCSKSSFYVQKFNFDIFFGWKTRENVAVLDILAVDTFDFTRTTAKKNFGEKLVKMSGFC